MIKHNLLCFTNLSNNIEFPRIVELVNIEIAEEHMQMKLARNAIPNIYV